MTLLDESAATMIFLVTKPLSLVKLFCLYGARILLIVVQTIVELLTAAICSHVNIIWGLVIWSFAFLSLPARIITALQRERLMELHFRDMHLELENLLWERKELEERQQRTIQELRMMRMMLSELDAEHGEAILNVELLKSELQCFKDENHRLKEFQSKAIWSIRGQGEIANVLEMKDDDKYGVSYDIQSWLSSLKGSDTAFQNLARPKDSEAESRNKMEMRGWTKTEPQVSGLDYASVHSTSPCIMGNNGVLQQRRQVAVSQSLFSAIFSLLVGVVIWTAEEPCTPLVVALFSVVCMSLRSVVQFFSTIEKKPASDAVMLLSLNWFILGTLAYPTLPIVARMSNLAALHVWGHFAGWLALSL